MFHDANDSIRDEIVNTFIDNDKVDTHKYLQLKSELSHLFYGGTPADGVQTMERIRSSMRDSYEKVQETSIYSYKNRNIIDSNAIYKIVLKIVSKAFVNFSNDSLILFEKLTVLSEKGTLFLITPVLLTRAGWLLSIKILGHLHLKTKFILFVKNLISTLKTNTSIPQCLNLNNKVYFVTLLGVGSSTIGLVLYKKFFTSTKSLFIQNKSLYTGLSGPLAPLIGNFRNYGSKLIFDVAKTASTFTNAALAGFLEPKKEVIKDCSKLILSNSDSITKTTKEIAKSLK